MKTVYNIDVYDTQDSVYIAINANRKYVMSLFGVSSPIISDKLYKKTLLQNRYLLAYTGETIATEEERLNYCLPEYLKHDWDHYCKKFRKSVDPRVRKNILIVGRVE